MLFVAILLVVVAFGFAVSIGAHYTGACVGMPYAAGAIRLGPALLLMAPLALVGAVLASGGVEATVGHGILRSPTVALGVALAIVASALVLTSAYNFLTIPTSTIQILVFSVVGAGLAAGLSIAWSTIGTLLVLWAIAPFAAFGLGFSFTWIADRWWKPSTGSPARGLGSYARLGLLTVGGAASFAMGANDVSNASGAFVMTGLFGLELAATIGGVGLALGVLTWGRPLLQRVAFDIVDLDARTATCAQLAQSAVILAAVSFGLFTSMNQALIGAMIGTGLARGRSKVSWKTVRGILIGWAAGPASGAALGFAVASALIAIHLA
jgi:inorganic phosphate transporter, PiT family